MPSGAALANMPWVCAILGERGWWIPPRGITRREAPVTMPVLAIGGEQSFGANQAVVMRNAATQVTEVVIPQAGHWLMEEPPAATMAAIRTFLDAKK
jgi:pimeloyl-ACP methyl ester carboxylesterase